MLDDKDVTKEGVFNYDFALTQIMIQKRIQEEFNINEHKIEL